MFWINDLNEDLSCFWLAARDYKQDLVGTIITLRDTYLQDGKSLFLFLKHDYVIDSTVKRAARFFILNRITFSGLTDSGGYSGESFTHRFTESSIDRLSKVSSHLQNVQISNLDFSNLLGNEGDNVFIFLDPPYYSQEKSKLYGKKGDLHTGFDHDRFADQAKNCPHNWLITYDACDYITNLFCDYHIRKFNLQYGMNQKNGSAVAGKEIIITNY